MHTPWNFKMCETSVCLQRQTCLHPELHVHVHAFSRLNAFVYTRFIQVYTCSCISFFRWAFTWVYKHRKTPTNMCEHGDKCIWNVWSERFYTVYMWRQIRLKCFIVWQTCLKRSFVCYNLHLIGTVYTVHVHVVVRASRTEGAIIIATPQGYYFHKYVHVS